MIPAVRGRRVVVEKTLENVARTSVCSVGLLLESLPLMRLCYSRT
jgi:hypothetical protein